MMDGTHCSTNIFAKGYGLLVRFGNCFVQPLVLLLFRLYWGWEFFITGRGKLLDHPRIVTFFTSLGLPMPDITAWFVGGVECFGGLLLLVGLFARPTAFILTINMLMAYLTVTDDRVKLLNIFSNPEPFVTADPFFYLLTAVLVLAFGPGLISIDAIVCRRCKKSCC